VNDKTWQGLKPGDRVNIRKRDSESVNGVRYSTGTFLRIIVVGGESLGEIKFDNGEQTLVPMSQLEKL